MKNGGLVLVLTIVMMVLVGISGLASAATISFQASDPTDTANPDFDIVAFGAAPNGNYINFWIQVRGNINTHPEDGFMNAYVIEISSNVDYEIASIWMTYNGNTQFLGWFKAGDNTNPLTSNDYTISGSKITYHLNADMFSNIGDEYNVTVTTVHVKGDNPSMLSTYTDEAEYYYNPQSGGSGGSNQGNSNGNNDNYEEVTMLYGMGALIYMVCGIIWFVIWILVAWWSYKDAKRRCMDTPIIWFLVVFFLGIIGLIIYLIIRKDNCQKEFVNIPPPPPS